MVSQGHPQLVGSWHIAAGAMCGVGCFLVDAGSTIDDEVICSRVLCGLWSDRLCDRFMIMIGL